MKGRDVQDGFGRTNTKTTPSKQPRNDGHTTIHIDINMHVLAPINKTTLQTHIIANLFQSFNEPLTPPQKLYFYVLTPLETTAPFEGTK